MTSRNDILFERAQKSIPGGVNSPVRAFRSVGGTPRFVTRGKGARIWDADDKEYIDYVGSWGPLLLGHAHPDVLRRMKRPASGERHLERLQAWRAACPELVIRSTFIAGFPGETEAEFEALLQFVREAQIDRAGCFAYSPVPGAAANEIPGALPDEVREERRSRFMAVAEGVSVQRLARRVGATVQVLVDQAPAMGRQGGVGRSYADAPEIDGVVRLLPPQKISTKLKVGEFARARVVATEGHDLVAQPL